MQDEQLVHGNVDALAADLALSILAIRFDGLFDGVENGTAGIDNSHFQYLTLK